MYIEEENQRNRDEVIKFLMNWALDHGFGVVFCYEANNDEPSECFPEYRTAVINANWKNINEIPFIIGHELGHLFLGHNKSAFYQYSFSRVRMEREANEFSLDLLTEYCDLNEIYFENKYTFANAFGLPKEVYYLLDEEA